MTTRGSLTASAFYHCRMQGVRHAFFAILSACAAIAIWTACVGDKPSSPTPTPDASAADTGSGTDTGVIDAGTSDAPSAVVCDASAPLGDPNATWCGDAVRCEAGAGGCCTANGACVASPTACTGGDGGQQPFFACTRSENCGALICCVRGTLDPPGADPCERTMSVTGSDCAATSACDNQMCVDGGCTAGFACRPTRIFLGSASKVVDLCIRNGK